MDPADPTVAAGESKRTPTWCSPGSPEIRRSPGKAPDLDARSADQRHLYSERLIDTHGAAIPGQQHQAMVTSGRSDKRVVDSSARDAEPCQFLAETSRRPPVQEARAWEVVIKEAEDVAWRSAGAWRETGQHGVGLVPRVPR